MGYKVQGAPFKFPDFLKRLKQVPSDHSEATETCTAAMEPQTNKP